MTHCHHPAAASFSIEDLATCDGGMVWGWQVGLLPWPGLDAAPAHLGGAGAQVAQGLLGRLAQGAATTQGQTGA